MATDFQPNEPYEEDEPYEKAGGPTPAGKWAVVAAALVSALAVVIIMALWLPSLFGSAAANWTAALGLGALVFAVVLGVGLL